MLKPDPTTTNYILYLLVSSFLPRGDVEGGSSEALLIVITTYYYTMLQQLLLHCYFHACSYKMLVVSLPVLQDIVGRC